MQRYIAFLCAINVGGRTVRMAHLRTLFESLGFHNVETFIASGNVVFDSSVGDSEALEEQIEQHLSRALGYEVATFLRSVAELAAIAAYRPFITADPVPPGNTLSIAFLKSPPSEEARQRLMRLRGEVDDFHVHGREAYWLCGTRISESSFSGALLERTLGTPATMRNVTTVRKLAMKYAALA
jgi:uncharacterized protein (DUF1697 family)